ncbi:MAG TPA: hypothetical protein VGI67_07450 [Thermoleophilaceae bacterium]
MRRRSRSALIAAVASAAFALGCLSAAPAGAAVGPGFYGMDAQWVFNTPQSTWATQLGAIAGSGLTTVRTDARWSNAEATAPSASGQHSYDWGLFDAIVGALAQQGLRWMPTLDYPPPWAQENPSDMGSEMTTGHVADFLAYTRALVQRYGIGGSFWATHPALPAEPVREWEIWNEPNVTYYWDPQNADTPGRYADLYLQTRQAIKAINPKALVMAGGLALVNPPIASDEIGFLKGMFAHDPQVASDVDVWGLHPYQETIFYTFQRFARWRQALDLLAGKHEQIAINELGYTTTKVSDATRGQELTELAQELPRSGCDIYDFFPYEWTSKEGDATDPEQWFGIWNADGTPKPSGRQFVNAVLQMRGMSSTPAPSDQLNLCDSQYPVPPDPQPVSPHSLAVPPATAPSTPSVAPPKPRGPGLRVRVARDRKHGLLKITVRCDSDCRLQAYLMARKPGKRRFKTESTVRTHSFSSKTKVLRLELPAHAARLRPRAEVIVVATQRSGETSRVTRPVRLR